MSKSAVTTFLDVYRRLLRRYGPQHWWPSESRFEIMLGAVLTQGTVWRSVEKSISNLAAAGALSPSALRRLPEQELARLIRPSGFHNTKARKLKALAEYVGRRFDDDLEAMAKQHAKDLRGELLGVFGIGEETADDILLYAADKPAFVVDSYSRRIFARLRLAPKRPPYSSHQALVTRGLPPEASLFAEYHALLVRHGREACRKTPRCRECCLLDVCPTGQATAAPYRSAS